MNPQQILGIQVLLSFVGWTLLARWYVSPRLAALPRDEALPPLLLPHAFRHMGLVFLLPTVTGGALPPVFAKAAAYGDLIAGLLALAALLAWRTRSGLALPLTWLFSVEGLADLANAFYQGLTHNVSLGAAYYIPTFAVPLLVVTHVMIVRMLLGHPSREHLPAPSHM